VLVNSCQDKSYLYLLAMGWNIVYQFRRAQNEIDRYLRLVPLITLVDNARVRVFFFLVSHLESIVLIFIHFLWGILVTIIKF
jgi:MCAfunc domain